MVLLGLLLVILSAGSVALLAAYNRSGGPEYSVTAFGNEIADVNGWQIFLAGVVLTLVFCLGLWMMTAAERRRRRMRAEIINARHDAKAAAAERDRLAEQLNEQNGTTAPTEHADTAGRRRFFGRHAARTPTTSGAQSTDGR